MNDLVTWAPLIVAGCVLWAGNHIGQMVQAANLDRREDHRELLNKVGEIENELALLRLCVDSIASDVAPPIDPENPPY